MFFTFQRTLLYIKNLQNGEFANIYVGFGIKAIDSPFNPTKTGEVENDPEGQEEHLEPNPEHEVESIESDSLVDDPESVDDADN